MYATGLGNHESGQRWAAGALSPDASSHFSLFDTNDGGGECGVVSTHVVPLPGNATPDAPYWAWSTGPFALVTLSSEHDFSTDCPCAKQTDPLHRSGSGRVGGTIAVGG